MYSLEEEAGGGTEQGKEGVRSGYLVMDLALAPWEDRWCHVSQSPVNNTELSGFLSRGLFPEHTSSAPSLPWKEDRICIS